MSVELVSLFTEDEIRRLDPGEIHDIAPTPGARSLYTTVKCSTNIYVHPDLGQEFEVKIVTGKTEEEHRAVQTGIRIAAKIVSDTDAPLEESGFADTDESTLMAAEMAADAQNDPDMAKIRFALTHPQKYKSPYQVQFLIRPSQIEEMTRIDPPQAEGMPREVTFDGGKHTSKNPPYEGSFAGTWITVWVDPDQVDGTNSITASLSWPDNGFKSEGRSAESAKKGRITLQPDGLFTSSDIKFTVTVRAQLSGSASYNVSGTYRRKHP